MNVQEFREKLKLNSKVVIDDSEFRIKQLVKFRLDDGDYYMKLFFTNGYVLADDLDENMFILVKEIDSEFGGWQNHLKVWFARRGMFQHVYNLAVPGRTTDDIIEKYNKTIEKFCQQNNIPFCPMYDLLNDNDLADGLHPNAQGHKKMFEQIKNFLEKEVL